MRSGVGGWLGRERFEDSARNKLGEEKCGERWLEREELNVPLREKRRRYAAGSQQVVRALYTPSGYT